MNGPAGRSGAVVKVGGEKIRNETRVRLNELEVMSVDHTNFIVVIIIITSTGQRARLTTATVTSSCMQT